MFWNKTITLYNKYEDEQTGFIKWHRHKLEHCFFKVTNNKITVGGVQLQTDENIIRIPAQKDYLTPYLWLQLPNDKKGDKMTLRGGDLIFLGDITDEIDEYTQGKRSSDIISKYSALGSVVINSVNINDLIPGAHYFVRGE